MRAKQLITLLGVLAGSTATIFVRWSTAPSLVLVVYRMGLTVLLLLPAIWHHRTELIALDRRSALLSIAGGCIMGLHFAAYFQALRLTSIASCAVLANLTVIFVAIGAVVIFRQKLNWRVWAAILLAFGGAIIITLGGSASGKGSLAGDLLAVAAAICLAAYTMIGAVCRRSVSTTLYTFLAYSAAALTAVLLCLISRTPLTGYAPANIVTALCMAVFCTLLGHSVASWALKYLPAPFVSTVQLLDCVFSTIWGVLLFQEIPTAVVLFGGVICILGILFYSKLIASESSS